MFLKKLIEASKSVFEAALAMNTSHGALHWEHMPAALKAHHGVTDTWEKKGPYVEHVFPSHVVYSLGGETYRMGYTIEHGAAGSAPKITLKGNPKKVHVAYADTQEGVKESFYALVTDPAESVIITLEGERKVKESSEAVFCMTDTELAAVKEAGSPIKIPIKIISPGWGSSAYYSKEVLKRDGPKVFTKGTHMYWNHATATEEAERPEGDLSDLAAILVKNAEWKEDGVKGPGLYSEAKVFGDYSQQVSEKGPYIGVSINASIKAHEGEIDGRTGYIADQFVRAYSTDFVTKAGAGGAPIVPVSESRRNTTQEQTMTEQEKQEFEAMKTRLGTLEADNRTKEAEISRLKEGQNVSAAVSAVSAILKEAEIPYSEKALARACANPTMKEGKVDPEWVKAVASDFSEGMKGSVTGLGQNTKEAEKTDEETKKMLESAMQSLGVPEKGLKAAVEGRII